MSTLDRLRDQAHKAVSAAAELGETIKRQREQVTRDRAARNKVCAALHHAGVERIGAAADLAMDALTRDDDGRIVLADVAAGTTRWLAGAGAEFASAAPSTPTPEQLIDDAIFSVMATTGGRGLEAHEAPRRNDEPETDLDRAVDWALNR